MARPLAGLTLLEAAAVPGETLAADAVANAIGPALAAAPASGRVAVAMSGGVDSAVALHRAGPGAVGVTLRLWLDPEGPDAERACCSPDAVLRAREACHARGLPHVTLDLREEFRRTVVASFVDGYAAGLTPNPCMRCNGDFRFAALVAFAERAGAEPPLDRALRPPRRARRPATGRARGRSGQGPVVHARHDPAAAARARRVPARERDQGGRPRRGGLRRPRRRAPSGEPGGLLPRGWRLPHVPRAAGRRPSARTDRGPGRRRARHVTTGSGASRPASGAASGSRPAEPLFALRADASTADARRRPSTLARDTDGRGDPARSTSTSTRAEVKLRYRSAVVEASVHGNRRRLSARARRAGRRRRPWPGRRSLPRGRRCRSRSDHGDDGVGSGAMPLALSAGDVAYWALAIFLVLLGVGSLFALFKLGQLFDRLSRLVSSTERDALAVVVKRAARSTGSTTSSTSSTPSPTARCPWPTAPTPLCGPCRP